jgi:hypothetical protein
MRTASHYRSAWTYLQELPIASLSSISQGIDRLTTSSEFPELI